MILNALIILKILLNKLNTGTFGLNASAISITNFSRQVKLSTVCEFVISDDK
jgi:hypothetical protein